MKSNAIAVLDVGKTNKKIRLYDREFNVLCEERTSVEPKDVEGLEVEDTDTLLQWFRESLKKLASDYTIQSIAITTHGATCALLDQSGHLAFPVISYTAEKGAEIQDEFYQTFGSSESLQKVTCTPDIGFANIAKILYYVKTRLPDVYGQCKHALFYTTYLGYELTGEMAMDYTYLGNHSYLWDFTRNDWSTVAKQLGADTLFPERLGRPWECLGKVKPDIAHECGLPEDCKVALGIHDSNANYLPYLGLGYTDFLLNSTGTWCVLMRNAPSSELTDDDIAKKVFFNMDAFGEPVRTCIFPAGMEYDTFRSFTELKDESDAEMVRKVTAERNLFVVPGVMPDATAFPGATPRVVSGDSVHTLDALKKAGTSLTDLGQEYFAALNISLALATRKKLEDVGVEPGTAVIIEGGFANNKTYCELLATLCPDQRIVLTSVKEGTSFGTAMVGWMLAEELSLEALGKEINIEMSEVPKGQFDDLDAYEAAFHKLLDK